MRAIRIHSFWVPAIAVLFWVLIDHFSRAGVDDVVRIYAAIVVAVLAFGSVLLRELGRQLAASTAWAVLTRVTLWPTGGVARLSGPSSPRSDVRVAASGLLISFVLAAAFAGAATATRSADLRALAAASDVLSRFNLAFGIFNLVPALPLDGGVLLRSWLRSRGASSEQATATAVRAGVWFGALLTAVGAARVVAGDAPGGIGLAVAGVIVVAGARVHGPFHASPRPPAARAALVRRGFVGLAVAVAMLVPAATLYHPPFALMSVGAPLDVLEDITIRGAPRINGRYVAASVQIQSPSALHAFVALFRPGIHVVRRSEVPPVTEDPFRASGGLASLFRQSRVSAAVAAAREVGLEATLRGTGARVVLAGAHARAAGIRPGDVIVSVDGRPVRLVLDVRDAVTSRLRGSVFSLGLERAGRRIETKLRSKTDQRSGGVPGLDVILETRDFEADLPFDIEFGSPGAGGPSAGLAYALAIADLLDPRDLAAGRIIAATGIVDLLGRVDPIVGARAKIDSALEAGADVFVLPFADAARLQSARISLLGVGSIDQALSLLAARAADGG